jgi:hypothetical protein
MLKQYDIMVWAGFMWLRAGAFVNIVTNSRISGSHVAIMKFTSFWDVGLCSFILNRTSKTVILTTIKSGLLKWQGIA